MTNIHGYPLNGHSWMATRAPAKFQASNLNNPNVVGKDPQNRKLKRKQIYSVPEYDVAKAAKQLKLLTIRE
jgi:hypothetical protein